MDKILLVLLVVIFILLLIWLFIWRFVFNRSMRKLIMSFLGLLIENTTKDGIGEPIEMDDSEHKADIMMQKAKVIDFEAAVAQTKAPQLEQAIIPPEERGELARDTSDNGWPRKLDDETRLDPRPFLDVHLRTETTHIMPVGEEDADNQATSDIPTE
jgi:hypothetical protein